MKEKGVIPGILLRVGIVGLVVSALVFNSIETVDKMTEAKKAKEASYHAKVTEVQGRVGSYKIGNILVDDRIDEYIQEYILGDVERGIELKHEVYRELREIGSLDRESAQRAEESRSNRSSRSNVGVSIQSLGGSIAEEIQELDEIVEKTEYYAREIEKEVERGERELEKSVAGVIVEGSLKSGLIITLGYILLSVIRGVRKKREEEKNAAKLRGQSEELQQGEV